MRLTYFVVVTCGVVASTVDSFTDATAIKMPTVAGQKQTTSFVVKEGNLVANVTVEIRQASNPQDADDDKQTKQESARFSDEEERALISPGMKLALKNFVKHPVQFLKQLALYWKKFSY